MTSDQLSFIASILGKEGAEALSKAVKRCEGLESVLIPRSILSWINTVSNLGYEGIVPGIDNSYFSFEKSEDGYKGAVTIGDYIYNFENSNVFHMASALALSLGIEPGKDVNVKDLDIEKLGKSIDLLVKAKVITNELLIKPKEDDLNKDMGDHDGPIRRPTNNNSVAESSKAMQWSSHAFKNPSAVNHKTAANTHKIAANMMSRSSSSSNQEWGHYHNRMANFHENRALQHHQFGKNDSDLEKEAPQGPSGQVAPVAPEAPKPPAAVGASVKKPKLPKLPKIKINKSELNHRCGLCNKISFYDGTFVGCSCLSDLAKSVKTEGEYLILGADWDADAVLALFESLGRNE